MKIVMDKQIRKAYQLEISGYSSRPFLCCKRWRFPLERVRKRYEACVKCTILAMERRKTINSCPRCKQSAIRENNDLMKDFMKACGRSSEGVLKDILGRGLLQPYLDPGARACVGIMPKGFE